MLAGIKTVMQNHGSTILTVAGVTGIVGSGVLACRATLKIQSVKIDFENEMEVIHGAEALNEDTRKSAVRKQYVLYGRQLLKTYGPALALGAISIGMIFYGHNILNKKTLAMAGAYKALTTDFDHYRGRVKERFGDELERTVNHDMRTMTIDDFDGTERTIEYVPEEMGANPTSDRSVFFDDSSIYFSDDPEENKKFLLDLEKRAQKEFDKNGYLLLNWVYKRLDVAETYAGANCGWVKGLGDDVIDFGIFDVYSAASRRFVNGLEPVILLNFNDDGYILDKI